MVKLAGGIVAGVDRRIAGVDPSIRVAALPPGDPVAVGPAGVEPGDETRARASLRRLIAAGGVVAAGADVDLGGGFHSARIEGGAGDRRDAVLAALAVPQFADRLGAPAALLVALFGPAATKPLGAATLEAIAAGRWPALRYAVAASDLLGPEQLVRLLSLTAPEGVDPFPDGLPSVVAGHLGRALGAYSAARRLRLLTDLWEQSCAAGTERLRRERLRESQGRQDRFEDLRDRRKAMENDTLDVVLHSVFGREPDLREVALWRPPGRYWAARFNRMMNDALAATVLARVAVTAAEAGVEEALVRHRTEIEAGAATLTNAEAGISARKAAGRTGLPARPGNYLRDLRDRVPRGARREAYVRERLARARDYGRVAMDVADDFLTVRAYGDPGHDQDGVKAWALAGLGPWRAEVGYLSPDRLGGWDFYRPYQDVEPLASRLTADPPAATELCGDFFWYAELADALARLHGHPAAEITPSDVGPEIVVDPAAPDEPLVPKADSIALAAARTAQLVELGGKPAPRPRSFTELVAGLLAEAGIAEALTGGFPIPPAVDAADGTVLPGAIPPAVDAADGSVLPGAEVRIEVARTGRQLADWAGYMGNCIAGEYYAAQAAEGRSVLVALRGADGKLVANVELRRSTGRWRVSEIRARFNDEPDAELLHRTREWVRTLTPPPVEPPAPEIAPARRRPARRPAAAARMTRELGDRLAAAVPVRPSAVLAGLIGAPPTAEGLVALRRAGSAAVIRGCRSALSGSGVDELWQASAGRPLSEAVAALPEGERERLAPLLIDAPMPGASRRLARLPGVAPAWTAEMVALRVRAALGELVRRDAPELADAMVSRPHGPLLRAAALTVTSWGGVAAPVTAVAGRRRVTLPGYPRSSLRDAGWEAAWADAVELGAVREAFWEQIAGHGLLVPSSWLRAGGWVQLWGRSQGR
ncbi:MAG: hypothetical protein ABW000_02380 [Actinoplanes sp.]